MFGCGLPVAARRFEALPELVRDGENGMVFDDAGELSDQLLEWFGDRSFGGETGERFRQELRGFGAMRWGEYWKMTALPVLREAVTRQ